MVDFHQVNFRAPSLLPVVSSIATPKVLSFGRTSLGAGFTSPMWSPDEANILRDALATSTKVSGNQGADNSFKIPPSLRGRSILEDFNSSD